MKIEVPLQFFLVCFLILGVSVFLGVLYMQKVETFIDANVSLLDGDIQLQACPSGTTSFTEKGELLCCDGDIVSEMCNGRKVCSVSSSKPGMPSCLGLLRQELRKKAVRFCPPSLPNYFEDPAQNRKGCTNGKRTRDGKAPLQVDQPKCTVYNTQSENQDNIDSCDNIKHRDTYKCPGNAKPTLVRYGNNPTLLSCTFTAPSEMRPITCYSDQTVINNWDKTIKDWRSIPLSRETKLGFCSNAQRYYIDRSLTDFELGGSIQPFKNGQKVFIRSAFNRNATATPGGGLTSAPHVLGWEIFTLEEVRPNQFRFKDAHGKYIIAFATGGVDTQSRNAGAWEVFTILPQGDGKYALKTYHNTYIRGNSAGAWLQQNYIGAEEKLTIGLV